MQLKYAQVTCVTSVDGTLVNITAGEAWDADDLVVRTKPDLFSDDPPFVRRYEGGLVQSFVVEEASAAPGQRRSTKRR
jgi:hypothetical protein